MDSRFSSSPKYYMHAALERADYAVSEDELSRLSSSARNLWKDVTLVSIPLAISCALNALGYVTNPPEFSWPLFGNSLIAGFAMLSALVFGIAWKRTSGEFNKVTQGIRDKPKFEVKQVLTASGTERTPTIVVEEASQITPSGEEVTDSST